MKNSNMKKALSLFLAALMIALALPLTLLTVWAESQPTAVNFTSVELHAQDGEGTAVGFTGANAIDGRLDDGRYYSTTSSKDVAKRAYFNNGAIDYKENGDYYGIIVAELEKLTELTTLTVWSPNSKAGGWLDNQAYEIWYSVDGTTFVNSNVAIADADNAHTPVDASAFPGEVGSYGINSDGSGLEGKIYKNEMNMNGIEAKYVAIAVTEPRTTTGSEKIVVWEITATGIVEANTTPVTNTVAVIESITNLGKRTKLGKDLTSDAITYTNDNALTKAFDGDYSTNALSNNLSSDYTPSVVFDKATGKFVVQNESYNDVLIIKLSEATALNDMTVWGESDKKSSTFMNNAFSIFYSADGITYTYVDSVNNMRGNGVNAAGANADLASETVTVGSSTYYGVKFNMGGVSASYVAIAVSDPTTLDSRIILNEVTFNKDGAAVTVESITNMGRRTKAGKNFDTEFITYTNDNALTKAFDGDYSTQALSNNLSSDYTPSVKFNSKDGKFVATPGLLEGDTYVDVLVIKLSEATLLNNMTVWGEGDKKSTSFLNDAFGIYYSADGVTYTYVDGVDKMRGDGIANNGANADLAYYTMTVGTSTYYGVNFDMNDVAASYVAIAVSKATALDNRVILAEVSFNDAEQTPPTPSNPGENEQPAGPTQMGIGIQSVTMPWRSYDANVGADADKELCATKMFDGDVDIGCVWRYNDKYDPSETDIAAGKKKLEYINSMVDGKIVDFDGEASDNDFYDYVIMDLSNDTDNKTYDVSVFRWWVATDANNISSEYTVYVSADGENWTLCESFDDMTVGYGPVYKYDKESEVLYHDVAINQDDVRYVMLTVELGRTTHDFLMWNVRELVVYEKGTEPKEEVKQPTTNDDTANNPKPNSKPEDTTTSTTNAPETEAVTEEKKGCGGSIGMGALAVVALTGAAVTLTRKRKED